MFYVKVATRGGATARKGSPRQALDYITDGHDTRRDPGYSDGELAYIARMGEGWKTDLEGGRVPLTGFGLLAGESDEAKMRAEFEASCLPTDRCATIGYKSITFTLPKEVSLFAEGHREKAREAMNAAVGAALGRAFPGMAYTAVGAIHTRNEAGEIHYHAHVLIGKFAVEHATGRVLSVNGKRGGNGPSRVRDLKVGWKESVEREFKERLGLTIEQRAPNAAPAMVMPDGSRLQPLNRASRRQLEKDFAPWYAAPDKSGAVVQRQLRLNAMDDRIFEVAAGGRPPTGWNTADFRELFPDQVRFIARYEKRVETLKSIGYLTPEGQLTPEFRLHFAIKNGIDTPELQRLRLDLANQNVREARRRPAHRRPIDLSESSDRSESVRRRVDRLGLSRDDIRRIQREAEARRPTPERLREIRIEALRRALVQPSTRLPRTKTVLRAFTDLQVARIQRVYPDLPPVWTARAISYRRKGFRPSTLLTSLLDEKRYPADELVALYHERWELELGYDEIKTHMLDRQEAIRSRTPPGVRQELWGIALAYNLVRLEMERAADEAGVEPNRISFVNALALIRNAWLAWSTLPLAPGRIPEGLLYLRRCLKLLILPPRRPERAYPRAVKVKMNAYNRKAPTGKGRK